MAAGDAGSAVQYADRIFRVYLEEKAPDGTVEPALLTPPAMDSAFASIEQATRVIIGASISSRDDQSFSETADAMRVYQFRHLGKWCFSS